MARSLVASRNGYGGVSQAFLELPGEEPSSVEDPDLDDVPSMFDVVHIAQEYVWRELAALVLNPNPPMDRDGRREDSGRG